MSTGLLHLLWLAVFLLPLVSALAVGFWRGSWAVRLLVLAPLPGLLTGLLPWPAPALKLDWLLLGTVLHPDAVGRVFLLFTAILWGGAGWFALGYLRNDPRRHRFHVFFLLTMAGNLGVLLAQDLLSFNLFFTLMSFASYGLIVHSREREALRAGRIYLVLVLAGEMLLYGVYLLLFRANSSLLVAGLVQPATTWTMFLLFFGFGIKAGVLPVHVWLPLAHPAAPAPASAVLSGAMIAAGLLGWLRFLPLGQHLPAWGALSLLLGFGAAFYGVAMGLLQQNPKTLLAYSSISQMGLMTAGVGLGLLRPGAWPAARAAVLLLVVHHGLAKGALFLATGVAGRSDSRGWRGRLLWAGLLLPAFTLSGVPFTSGIVAKAGLQKAAAGQPGFWGAWFPLLLVASSFATTLLLLRFLQLLRPKVAAGTARAPELERPWALVVAASGLLVWFLPQARPLLGKVLEPWKMAAALGPVLLAVLAAGPAWRLAAGRLPVLPVLPVADLFLPLAMVGRWLLRLPGSLARNLAGILRRNMPLARALPLHQSGRRAEALLRDWLLLGLLFLVMLGAFFFCQKTENRGQRTELALNGTSGSASESIHQNR